MLDPNSHNIFRTQDKMSFFCNFDVLNIACCSVNIAIENIMHHTEMVVLFLRKNTTALFSIHISLIANSIIEFMRLNMI